MGAEQSWEIEIFLNKQACCCCKFPDNILDGEEDLSLH